VIRPLRRCHRALIGIVIITLTLAALLAIAHQPPDPRIDALPASLLSTSSADRVEESESAPETSTRDAAGRSAERERGRLAGRSTP
jgi:hypothetical protein